MGTWADPRFEKGGAQWVRRRALKTFLNKLGDFLKNLGQKRVGVRPPPPVWTRAWGDIKLHAHNRKNIELSHFL